MRFQPNIGLFCGKAGSQDLFRVMIFILFYRGLALSLILFTGEIGGICGHLVVGKWFFASCQNLLITSFSFLLSKWKAYWNLARVNEMFGLIFFMFSACTPAIFLLMQDRNNKLVNWLWTCGLLQSVVLRLYLYLLIMRKIHNIFLLERFTTLYKRLLVMTYDKYIIIILIIILSQAVCKINNGLSTLS